MKNSFLVSLAIYQPTRDHGRLRCGATRFLLQRFVSQKSHQMNHMPRDFFFVSHRGLVKDAGILGLKDADSFVRLRGPAGTTPAALAGIINAMRRWETLLMSGRLKASSTHYEPFIPLSALLNLLRCSLKLLIPEPEFLKRRFERYE